MFFIWDKVTREKDQNLDMLSNYNHLALHNVDRTSISLMFLFVKALRPFLGPLFFSFRQGRFRLKEKCDSMFFPYWKRLKLSNRVFTVQLMLVG